MIFTEFRFFWFFAIVFLVYWLMQRNSHRKIWLFICSYIFYGAWDWRFLSLIWLSTVIDYMAGVKLADTEDAAARKKWLILSMCGNLGLLGFFKYFNFFVGSTADFLDFLGLPMQYQTLKIVLPAGISFYTFQTMSYTIDVYRGKLEAVKNFRDFALFVSFFPQLVAGPIVRAADFLPQLTTAKSLATVNFRDCLVLFLVGFIKKACISDRISVIVDQYFTAPDTYTASSAWVGVLFYAVQIYCDFSGYTDMAIATAGLLGYELCANFDFPYFATNISEFWRRWHMSLSTWLRDYLYIPLGGNRGTKLFAYRNLMLTMLLGGLWHGAGWNFVIWGGLHGGALVFHRVWSNLKLVRSWASAQKNSLALAQILPFIGAILTFYWVCLAWIFFRARDFHSAISTLQSFVLFHSNGTNQLDLNLLWVFAFFALIHFATYRRLWHNWWHHIPGWSFAAFYGFAFSLVLLFIAPNYAPFIYFQF
ncbi:MAG TPA: MBOAT family protein [Oscillatoriaceae cyanobacterium M33_DOE_052]|uniref:MBOAT family protein n=1 Tax=Planktothricoides sp. SpSt-374 TaxID=2282167 RepID=A0A7C3ZJ44_9CYAN|nr:MBOAT family protein [Oscillatoriaceae cyanobacterium M33_DOE_052]